jgi:hypothetical protein
MPSRRILRSVLWNFLGTYTSRYSDYGGYWLFGMLTRELEEAEFDLLAEHSSARALVTSADQLAVREFADQLAKSGLDRSCVTAARLHVERVTASSEVVDIRLRVGSSYRFRARATADTGRTFERETIIFVAPHDARLERKSARASRAPAWLRGPRARGRLDE